MNRALTFSVVSFLILLNGRASGQFTTGNLVVARFGDGVSAFSNSSIAVGLQEYTTAGTPGFGVNFDTTGPNAFTFQGNSATQGQLTLSADRQFLVLGGFNASVATADLEFSNPITTNRIIARVAQSGAIDVSTRLNDMTGPIRAAVIAGSSAYAVGENGGRVTTFGNSGNSISVYSGDSRATAIYGGQLYVSSGSASAPFNRGIVATNPALPAGAATLTNVVSPAAGETGQFVLLDRDATVPGFDTIYLANTGSNTIEKYSFDGTNWTARGSIGSGGANLRGLTAQVSGANVDVYFTSASELRSFSDTAAFNDAITGTPGVIATAGAGYQFRGVSFAPVPEPVTILGLAALGLGGVRLLRRRRSA